MQPEPGHVAGHVHANQRPGTAGASAVSVSGASREERFFAIPFDEVAGFEEVAERARSLATLPVELGLDPRTGEMVVVPDRNEVEYFF